MPVVPKSSMPMAPALPAVDPTYLAMAAGQMEVQGRLFEVSEYEDNWNSLSEEQQTRLLDNTYKPKSDEEENKYDETLSANGSVFLKDGKKTFGPDEWQWHELKRIKGIRRFDVPNKGTILTLNSDLMS